MANTASYVSAGKPATGGAVFRADAATLAAQDMPSDATTSLAADFKELGYCSEDGLVNSNSPSTTNINDWGKTPVLVVQDEKTDTFKITLIEALNIEVLKSVYGSGKVTGTLATGMTVSVGNNDPEEGVWAVDMVMNGGALKRVVIPRGVITEVEDITYTASDAVGYGITITALQDSTGHTHYEYIKRA